MKPVMQWIGGHRKAITAAAVGALTVATYVFGSQNPWVVAAGAVLATAGVHFVPNQPPAAAAGAAEPPAAGTSPPVSPAA